MAALPLHAQKKVIVLDLNTPIYAATARYIESGLQKAEEKNADFVIIKINTPGGLLEPTRKIVGSIMNAPMPVVSFVTPSGAHAGSAGAFIALSANFCAMSPGTNLGASHPVLSQGIPDSVMNQKMTEDVTAFLRSIAEKRDRDTTQLLLMVTNSRAFSAQQALSSHTIDFMAENVPDLLRQLHNRTFESSTGQTITLQTEHATIQTIEMSSKERFLNELNSPNIMYLLLLLGIMGILFEFFNPGAFAPAIIGVICLILAGYGMSLLPVDYTGLALIVLAIVLFILELKFPSHALLSIGGVVSLFIGSVFLIKKAPSFDVVQISWSVLITSVVVTAAFFIFLIGIGLKAQTRKTKTGLQGLIGLQGITMETLAPEGRVRVNGEFWKAVSVSGNLSKDTPIEVVSVEQFMLSVKSLSLPQ